MNAAQAEYIRNARRNLVIAEGLSPFDVSHLIHTNWAKSYYRMYLESIGAKNINRLVNDVSLADCYPDQ
jgi:hypothetical protein